MPSPPIPRRRQQRITTRRGRVVTTRSVTIPPRTFIRRAPRRLLALRRRVMPSVPIVARRLPPPISRPRRPLVALRRGRLLTFTVAGVAPPPDPVPTPSAGSSIGGLLNPVPFTPIYDDSDDAIAILLVLTEV